MSYSQPARTAARRIPRTLGAGLLVVIAAIAAAAGYRLLAPAPSAATSPIGVPGGERRGVDLATGPDSPHAGGPLDRGPAPPRGPDRFGRRPDRRLGLADGVVPDGTTVFDDAIPGVANLDPALLSALRQAAADAADDGVELYVDSGWRSPGYQNQLLREAISEYGSAEEAARWVATADTSLHVAGGAVDIGPADARAWLSEHGAQYGLCQTYHNEPWHYELRPAAIDRGCPPMYADPTHDPRL